MVCLLLVGLCSLLGIGLKVVSLCLLMIWLV